MKLSYKKVLINGRFHDNLSVCIEGGLISSIAPCKQEQAQDGYLLPGFIDLHIHGIQGVDMMQGEDAVLKMSQALPQYGVTGFLPTTMNAGIDETRLAVAGSNAAMGRESGAKILGIHLEGPFLSGAHPGVQAVSANMPPSLEAFHQIAGGYEKSIRLVTLAPELDGALSLIRALHQMGIAVSAGHSGASYEQMLSAVDAGLSQVTHLFNGMNPLHHRNPGVPGAALSMDQIKAQVIADFIHLHPAVVKLACRAKGPDGVLLITDAMAACGMGDGEYSLGNQRVFVKDGTARIAAGNLAGSTLTLDRAVRNLVSIGIPLEDACTMASQTPARAGNLQGIGSIAVGQAADLAILNDQLFVQQTYIDGKLVFQA